MKLLLVSALALAAFGAFAETKLTSDELLQAEWKEYKATHGKMYESKEQDEHRFQIYMASRRWIADHNYKYATGTRSYRKGLNKFSDMRTDEFLQPNIELRTHVRASGETATKAPKKQHLEKPVAPQSIDWREKGVVTPVKEEGDCRSSWAFSALGALEGAHAIKTGKSISLSAQQLIDCHSKESVGCKGGSMYGAYKYIIGNHGIESEQTYPYEAKKGKCHFNASNVAAKMENFEFLDGNDEIQLMETVEKMGPVSGTIHVHDSLVHYKDGIYSIDDCSSSASLLQGILIVGYGTDPEHGDYWIIKNSWGSSWGDSGYFKLARNKNNMCGIGEGCSYVIV